MRVACLKGLVLILSLLGAVAMASAGQVWLVDGKTLEGESRFGDGFLIVTTKTGTPAKVDLAKLLYASFSPPNLDGVVGAGGLGPLRQRSVGRVVKSGVVAFGQGAFTLTSNGGDIWGTTDNFDYFQQDFHGNGEIVARMLDISRLLLNAKIGLMIRATNEPTSPYAMIYVTGARDVAFRFRQIDGQITTTIPNAKVKLPIWLKLVRDDRQFIGYKSLDGKAWQLVARVYPENALPVGRRGHEVLPGIDMKLTVPAGLAMAAGAEATQAMALVDQVNVKELVHPVAPDVVDPAARPPEMVAVPLELSGTGVLTRNGTFISNPAFASMDKTTLHFSRAGGPPLAVDYTQLARINIQPLTRGMLDRLPKGRPGVLLTNGDFMEGEIGGLADGQVTVSSVVFGLSSYRLKDEVRSVIFRAARAIDAPFRVQLIDGSVLAARSIKASPSGELTIDDQSIGPVTLAAKDLYVLRAGGDHGVLLTDLKPDKIDAPSGYDPVTSSVFNLNRASWMNVAGVLSERGIVAPGPSTLTYTLNGGYRTFVCRAGVPDNVPSKALVRFVVLADGKELFRSNPPRTSKDAPMVISAPLTGVKELKLVIEMGDESGLPSYGLWGDPLLGK